MTPELLAPSVEHLRMFWDLSWTLLLLAASVVACWLSLASFRDHLNPQHNPATRTGLRAISQPVLFAVLVGIAVLNLVVPT